MRRFFVSAEEIKNNKAFISGSNAHHLATVLRLKEGAKIIVFDGTGWEYVVVLKKITKELVEGEIEEKRVSLRETKSEITLIQGIPKGDKMDFIIQKCTELGVAKIIPLITERTVVKLDKERMAKKQNRWQKIAQEAAKQCQRATVPVISEIYSWPVLLTSLTTSDPAVVLWEEEEARGFKDYLQSKPELTKLQIIIGPEGGFSQGEIEQLREKGVQSVTLGPRILRTETAGLAALTMVLYQLGDLG